LIETARLVLLPATVQTLRAEKRGDHATLASLLSVEAPSAWPPDLYDDDAVSWSLRELEENPERGPWRTYYFVLKQGRTLVGAGGYVSGPGEKGEVELGYSVLQAHQRQGYASEATAAMVARAFEEVGVNAVIAHTYPDLVASIGVLEKCGFCFDGGGEQEGVVRYRHVRA
jgi:RimJ/RimL family protein N-acetyltransferase